MRIPEPSRPWQGEARADYRERLHDLVGGLVTLGQDVAEAIGPAGQAFLLGERHALAEAPERHRRTHDRCRQLESEAFAFIAREAPVSGDLRHVGAVVRAITDVERASKLIAHVVGSLATVDAPALSSPVRGVVVQLADDAERIFVAGLEAWRDLDGLAVNELERHDDAVDQAQERLLATLYTAHLPVEDVVGLALVGRYYERLADHGVALAGHIAWALTGDRVPGAR